MLSRRRNLESPVPLAPMKAGSIATHASISPRFFFFPPFFPFPFFSFFFFLSIVSRWFCAAVQHFVSKIHGRIILGAGKWGG